MEEGGGPPAGAAGAAGQGQECPLDEGQLALTFMCKCSHPPAHRPFSAGHEALGGRPGGGDRRPGRRRRGPGPPAERCNGAVPLVPLVPPVWPSLPPTSCALGRRQTPRWRSSRWPSTTSTSKRCPSPSEPPNGPPHCPPPQERGYCDDLSTTHHGPLTSASPRPISPLGPSAPLAHQPPWPRPGWSLQRISMPPPKRRRRCGPVCVASRARPHDRVASRRGGAPGWAGGRP